MSIYGGGHPHTEAALHDINRRLAALENSVGDRNLAKLLFGGGNCVLSRIEELERDAVRIAANAVQKDDSASRADLDRSRISQHDFDRERLEKALGREGERKSFTELLTCANRLYPLSEAASERAAKLEQELREATATREAQAFSANTIIDELRRLRAAERARGDDYRERMRMACESAVAIRADGAVYALALVGRLRSLAAEIEKRATSVVPF